LVLCRLLRSLAQRYPLRQVVGHEHVAPVRKTDPGPAFDWMRLARGLACSRPHVPLIAMARP
jgi:N-acetyl-anhydromuramoyl-L-alanine amidase